MFVSVTVNILCEPNIMNWVLVVALVLVLVCGALVVYILNNSVSVPSFVSKNSISNASGVYDSMFSDASVPYTNYQTERIFDAQSSIPENRVSVL